MRYDIRLWEMPDGWHFVVIRQEKIVELIVYVNSRPCSNFATACDAARDARIACMTRCTP